MPNTNTDTSVGFISPLLDNWKQRPLWHMRTRDS